MTDLASFLERIAHKPARVIVSTQELTAEGVQQARDEGRLLVLDNGLGFAVVPMKLDLGPMAAPDEYPNALQRERILATYRAGASPCPNCGWRRT
jgi:hypothetical protein